MSFIVYKLETSTLREKFLDEPFVVLSLLAQLI